MKFSDLAFEPTLNAALERLNFSECTPIQEEVSPLILDGKDVAGLAQTGTGKTAAFLLPLMDRILKGRRSAEGLSEEEATKLKQRSLPDWKPQNFILVLVPTRELAEQVFENVEKFGRESQLTGVAIYGGTSYDKQKTAISNGVNFVVATPGRLIDLYKEHIIDLRQVRAIVFDEADRMFDMGFKDDMKFILQRVPRERQFLVFSATLNFDVLNTAYQFGAEPVECYVSRDQAKAENVKDEIFHVGNEDKAMYLLSLIKKLQPKQVIVFSNYKTQVERLARFLTVNGIPAAGISSLLTQAQRNKVMEQFKADNNSNVLVATDVAARGLDIKGVDLVVNFEMPMDPENYVHRIGRTGRAGAEGRAYSLVSDRDVDSLSRVEDYLKNKLPIGWIEEADLLKDFKPIPYDDGSILRNYDEPRGGGERPRRGGGDRGPRSGGRDGGRPSRDRGPRSEQKQGQGGGRHRDRDRDRGPRPDRPDRPGEKPKQVASGPKPQVKGSRPQPKKHDQHRPKPKGSGKGSHSRPIPVKKQAPGIVSKVSGFFKRLLGP